MWFKATLGMMLPETLSQDAFLAASTTHLPAGSGKGISTDSGRNWITESSGQMCDDRARMLNGLLQEK